jgi:hypothetical protein
MSDIASPFPDTALLQISTESRRARRARAADDHSGRRPDAAAPVSVTVILTAHQIALLDEWIGDQTGPMLTRAEALTLHFDASIARCASKIDVHPRSSVEGGLREKDVL